MRVDLSAVQWSNVEEGVIDGPDGLRYQRRGTRAKARDVRAVLEGGAPMVLWYHGGGQLDWFDGEDVMATWEDVRRHIVRNPEPGRARQVQWTAGRWESDGGPLVLLTGHC